MARKNRNSTKGRNSGRKFQGRQWEEPLDPKGVFYQINLDAKMFGKVFDKLDNMC